MAGYDGPPPEVIDAGEPMGRGGVVTMTLLRKGDLVEFDFSPSKGHEPAGTAAGARREFRRVQLVDVDDACVP